MAEHTNNFPKLHNAAWPGLVGKGDGGEPPIDLDTMLDMTAAAEVDGVKFEGFDIFLYHPHFDIDGGDDVIQSLAEKAKSRNLNVGTVVAPIYDGTGGGSPIGTPDEQKAFIGQVEKACKVAQRLKELGARCYGNVRFDTGIGVEPWAEDPEGNMAKIAETFQAACRVAADHGEAMAAEGEICWGGMHSWRRMIQLLEMVDRPNIGFQADMSHTLLYLMGFNAPEDALLPDGFDFSDQAQFDEAYATLTDALRPWTIELHVAQNDGTVHGSGSHDKTGRHCQATDPNGKLDITRAAGYWLRGSDGEPTKKVRHLCWDGCMFPNDVMMKPQTWNDILAAMIAVRDAHGWTE
jgi:sugar phosphate isomerase/epimerase